MIIEGKFTLKAPIQLLWDTMLDPETLRSCIPGAEKIDRLDEKTYDCVIKQKVGPISVRFKFKNTLTKIEPPNHVEMEGEGEDISKAGRFTQRTTIDLREKEGGEVEISYQCNANIVGKLAMFGDRILKAKAKKLEADFTAALKEKLKSVVSNP
ncbi:MAG: carbon monoxide dehydrogenase subunit G [Candidatus Aminicenantes bacterium]|nr:MAG: carbon monoxide dehydrogenase subunit G [Candidatus Aminicenantes bacterium]